MGPVLLETKAGASQSRVGAPYIRGIDAQIETNMSVLPSSIVDGKFDVSDRGLLVGNEFAHNMGLQVGDIVEIGSPSMLEAWRKSSQETNAPVPVLPEYEVRGIFDVGYYEYNLAVVVISLVDAQELYDLHGSVHGLMVMLHDPYKAQKVEKELARTLGPDYQLRSWMRGKRAICSTR